MPNTTLNSLPYPAGTEVAGTGDLSIKALADALDLKLMNHKNVTNLAVPAAANFTSASKLTRRGNVVELYINVTATANTANGATCLILPAAHLPVMAENKYFAGVDSASAGLIQLVCFSGGAIGHVFSRTSGQASLGTFTYLSDV